MPKVNRKEDVISIINKMDNRLRNVERVSKYDDETDEPPLPPSVTLTIRAREVKQRLEYRAVVTWGLVSPNTCQADVERWIIQLRPTDSGGTPIDLDTIGGNPYQLRKEKRVDNKGETDVHAVFDQLQKPKKWYWQARVAIRDKAHRIGPFSAWTSPQLPFTDALPKPPTPTGLVVIYDTLEKTRWNRLRAILQWNEVTNWDVPGGDVEDDMRGYQVAFRRSDAGGSPIGSYTRKKVIEAKDTDVDTLVHTVFQKGIKKQYYYQARVRSIDRWNRRGDWSAWTAASQATVDTTPPPQPTNVVAHIDQHRIVVQYDGARDPADSDVLQEDIVNFQIQVSTNAGFTGIIRDVRTNAEHKSFKIQKPQNQYWVRVRTHDASWNKSNWVSTNATKVTPNAPTVAISFDAGGPKRSRYRVIGLVTPGTTDIDDDVAFYRVQFVHKASAVAPTAGEPRRHQDTDPDDDLKVSWGNIRKSHFTWMRVRAIDHQGRKSNYSAWTAGGLPTASVTPSLPLSVSSSTHPRRVVTTWTEPANTDDEIVGYKVEVRRGGALRETRFVKHAHHRYVVPVADRGLSHNVRVFSVDDMGNLSTPAGDTSATPNDRLDDTDLLDAFNQGATKTYTFQGNIRLTGGAGAFQTGDGSVETVISMSRLDGKDQLRFRPFGSAITVLEAKDEGIRWGSTSATSETSLLAQDGTVQLFKKFTWNGSTGTRPTTPGTSNVRFFLANRGGGNPGLGLWIRFSGGGATATKQLAHDG